MAVAAGFVSPTPDNDDLVALLEAGRLGHEAADLVNLAGNLVAQCQREYRLGVRTKIPVYQLNVSAAHAGGTDLDQNLIRFDLGDRNIFQEPEAGCKHAVVRRA